MRTLKITHVIKAFVLTVITSFTIGNAVAQNHSVTVKMNYLPVIAPNTPSIAPDTFSVCEYVTLNLKTLYVSSVDTNSVALADASYILVFSTAADFSSPITGPSYSYTLSSGAPQTIYAMVTMNNTLACSNDTFSFVLKPRSEPTFTTQMLTACYGMSVNLTQTIQSLTDGGASPLMEFSTDSANFTAVSNPASYNANALGGTNGGNYKLYARLQNTDAGSGCYSLIVPFTLHIDTMPTLTLTVAATSGATEVCDGTAINLESYVSSVSPSAGANLEFSIGDAAFTTPLSGTAATSYILTQNNIIQSALTIYVRAKMNTTSCVSVGTNVKNFDILINPMPKLVLTATANGDSVCDATTINLGSYVGSYTSGATLQFASDINFTTPITGAAAASYALNLGNATTQSRQFFVRAVISGSGCVTVNDSVKNFTLKTNPAPTVQTITPGLANGCSDNIIAYSIPSQVGATYLWTFTGGTRQGLGTGAKDSVLWGGVNPTAQAQVVYTLTTGTKACLRTATLNVEVKQSPTDVNLATVAGSTEFCDNGTQEIQLKVGVTGGAPNFVVNYSWSPNNGAGSVTTDGTPTTFTVTLPNKGVSYAYTINKVTDANGCILP